MPGFDAMRAQQEAFFKAMTGGMGQAGRARPMTTARRWPTGGGRPPAEDELTDIKKQLAELQSKLSKM
jgi:hypothetical protein